MSENCVIIHKLFNSLKRFRFPFNEDEIPLNGIYVLFEEGEFAHGANRIVRVGTHTGKNQLRSRLKQHFINENKDRSIFRKNIGRAILNKQEDPFLKIWEIDLTTREAKDKYSKLVDFDKQKKVEEKVTRHMQDKFSFVVFQVDDLKKRLELESKIISTISLCEDCKPSKNWLGLSSPKEKIKDNGLWLVNELNKEPLDNKSLKELILSIQDSSKEINLI